MSFRIKHGLAIATVVVLALSIASESFAKKPGTGGGNTGGSPDLTISSVTPKLKTRGTTTTLNNVTVVVQNTGDGTASNPSLSLFLSSSNELSTETLATSSTLVKSVSLGAVKANKSKKRTFGGGLFKSFSTSGQYLLAVVDNDNVTSETNENNNMGVSTPLP